MTNSEQTPDQKLATAFRHFFAGYEDALATYPPQSREVEEAISLAASAFFSAVRLIPGLEAIQVLEYNDFLVLAHDGFLRFSFLFGEEAILTKDRIHQALR